ncbi:hypothetical protein QYF61_005805 [Mycteria americana]|uniref:Uncharacterized protein n=1 Tax=Mycteria americana TaxID=33587 RepID=A0AAN7RUU9_MYCAM|nr:hypothetical protein QYF61_005805 [Mycteria americana]
MKKEELVKDLEVEGNFGCRVRKLTSRTCGELLKGEKDSIQEHLRQLDIHRSRAPHGSHLGVQRELANVVLRLLSSSKSHGSCKRFLMTGKGKQEQEVSRELQDKQPYYSLHESYGVNPQRHFKPYEEEENDWEELAWTHQRQIMPD